MNTKNVSSVSHPPESLIRRVARLPLPRIRIPLLIKKAEPPNDTDGGPCDTDQKRCCITITFGDVCENNAGMQKIGTEANVGFTKDNLETAKTYFEARGKRVDLFPLSPLSGLAENQVEEAYLLVVRKAIDKADADKMLAEQEGLPWDTKAKMRGRVVNKRARHNLCYADEGQEPDYEKGQGRIIAFKEIPLLKGLRAELANIIGTKGSNLVAEGNLYYDPSKCGIGFHGDAERRKVIALRLGASIPLHYQWYHGGQRIGTRFKTDLHHGDLYIMSSKAVGFDWRKRKIPTLRHAAGSAKFLA